MLNGRCAIHADRAAGHAAKDIAAANDHYLHTHGVTSAISSFMRMIGRAVDAECIIAHQASPDSFNKMRFVGWHGEAFVMVE
jgi:hypothetical protein